MSDDYFSIASSPSLSLEEDILESILPLPPLLLQNLSDNNNCDSFVSENPYPEPSTLLFDNSNTNEMYIIKLDQYFRTIIGSFSVNSMPRGAFGTVNLHDENGAFLSTISCIPNVHLYSCIQIGGLGAKDKEISSTKYGNTISKAIRITNQCIPVEKGKRKITGRRCYIQANVFSLTGSLLLYWKSSIFQLASNAAMEKAKKQKN